MRASLLGGACVLSASLAANTPLRAQTTPPPPPPATGSREVVQPLPPPEAEELNAALGRLAINARDVNALIDAGNAALKLGDMAGAIGFFGRADDLSSGNPRIKMGLARAFVRTERPIEALRLIYEAEASGAPTLEVAGERALAYDLVGDNAKAQTYYRRALAQRDDDETRRRLALSQAIVGDEQGMEATLRPMLDKQDRAAFRTRALGLAALGKTQQAEELARVIMPPQLAQRVVPYLSYFPRLTAAQKAAAGNLGIFPRPAQVGRDDPRITAYMASRGGAVNGANQSAASAAVAARPAAPSPAQSVPATTRIASAASATSAAAPPAANGQSRLVPRGEPLGPKAETPPQTAKAAASAKPAGNDANKKRTAKADRASETEAERELRRRIAREERRARRDARFGRYRKPRRVVVKRPVPEAEDAAAQTAKAQTNTAAQSAMAQTNNAARTNTANTGAAALGPRVRETGTPKNTAAELPPLTPAATPTPAGNVAGQGEQLAVAAARGSGLPRPITSVAVAPSSAADEASGSEATESEALQPDAAAVTPSPAAPEASAPALASKADAKSDDAVSDGAVGSNAQNASAIASAKDEAEGFDLAALSGGFSAASSGVSNAGSDAAPKPEPQNPSLAKSESEASDLASAFAGFTSAPTGPAKPIKGAVDITAITPPRADAEEAGSTASASSTTSTEQHPSRIWVQVATGGDVKALGYDWRRIKRGAGEVLSEQEGHIAPWGNANRLLAGPYDSKDAARSAINALKAEGVDSLMFTSAAGEEVTPLS